MKHEFQIGKQRKIAEKVADSKDSIEMYDGEVHQALEIILGLEKSSETLVFKMRENDLVKRAREFRAEFEKMQSNK